MGQDTAGREHADVSDVSGDGGGGWWSALHADDVAAGSRGGWSWQGGVGGG